MNVNKRKFTARMFCMARSDSLKCTRSSTFERYTSEVT